MVSKIFDKVPKSWVILWKPEMDDRCRRHILGGGFKHFCLTLKIGEMIQFDEHIVQMVWFNHQLEHNWTEGPCATLVDWILCLGRLHWGPNEYALKLEDPFPFKMVPFQGTCLLSRGVHSIFFQFEETWTSSQLPVVLPERSTGSLGFYFAANRSDSTSYPYHPWDWYIYLHGWYGDDFSCR